MAPTTETGDCVGRVSNITWLAQLADLGRPQTVLSKIGHGAPKPPTVTIIFVVPPCNPKLLKNPPLGSLIAA